MAKQIKKSMPWSIVLVLVVLIAASSLFIDGVKDAGADTVVPSVQVGNSAPTMSGITLDDPTIDATTISLTENATRVATATGTATDTNGDTDISSATATIYKSDVANGSSCTANNNTCYQISSGNCTITAGVANNDAQVVCTANMQFHATPSDGDSTIWTARITATDAASATGSATNSTETIEVTTLNALDVSGTMSYTGPLAPGATSTSDSNIVATTTGNAEIDSQFSGLVMQSGANTIAVAQQRYNMTSGVAYESMSFALSGSATCRELTSSGKPTTSPSDKTDTVYWRIGIPGGQATGTYSGTTTLTAVVSTSC